MQIKSMPVSERPQEKLLFAGASGLSNSELLALIIRTGTSDKSAIQLAEEVIAYASTDIGDLGRADARELMKLDGIGQSKACSIVAAMELSKRLMAGSVGESHVRIREGNEAVKLMQREMMYEKRELFMTLLLNTRLEIESKSVISIGNLDNAPVHPREVFAPAVRRSAAAIIVAHNHPSGDPTPSNMDIEVTRRLIEASHVLGIRLVDHLIIGKGRHISLRESGIIPEWI